MARPPRQPTREQIALQETMLSREAPEVAQFLLVNSGTMRPFLKLNTQNFDELIDALTKGAPRASRRALEYIDEFLDNPDRLPTKMRLTDEFRKPVVKAQRQTEADLFKKNAREKRPVRALTNLYAWTMAAMGYDTNQRIRIAGLGIANVVAGAAVALGVFSQDAEAALPQQPAEKTDSFNDAASGAQDSLARRFGPLEITVSPHRSAVDPFSAFDRQDKFKLMASLTRRMDRDPQAKQYVAWLKDAAAQCGLSGNLFANQIYKESWWFDADVISGKDQSNTLALGIAQFKPATAKAYGLKPEELFDPKKSIYAAADYMCDLTKQYGDQQLAMVAYNGGPRAVNFVKNELGTANISIDQWMDFMRERRSALGTEDNTAWHNQTFSYLYETSSQFWDTPKTVRVSLTLPTGAAVPLPLTAPRI